MNVLPPLYLHHYGLLVCAMHILLQGQLSETKIVAAEVMLADYYKLLPELYGSRSCNLNAHSLIHLTQYVRQWGPLWTHSAFGFESMNGHLTSMLHSTYKVADQLLFSIDVHQTLSLLCDKLHDVENEQTLSFLSSSIGGLRRQNMMLLHPDIYAVGPVKSENLTSNEKRAIQALTECRW